jgi:ABC-type phosphate transport system substrate-binding protein
MAIGVAVFGMVQPGFAGTNAPQVGEVARNVLGSGSDTTYFVLTDLDTLYNSSAGCEVIALPGDPQPLDLKCLANEPETITTENYRHDRIGEAAPLGSSNGISQLCQQGTVGIAKIDFARSSRAPRASDCTGMTFVAFAKDAIPPEAFPDLPGSPAANINNPDPLCAGKGFCLTTQQLTKIFVTCEINNWSQVGGANAPMEVWAAQDGSGTRATFDGFIGGASDSCLSDPSHEVTENQNIDILASPNPENAIFYFSFGDWQKEIAPNPDGSALGGVDGVAPTVPNIQNGSYAFSRLLYNVYCKNCAHGFQANQATRQYVGERGWICKPNQQHSVDPITGVNYGAEVVSTIQDQGFITLPVAPLPGGGQARCQVAQT